LAAREGGKRYAFLLSLKTYVSKSNKKGPIPQTFSYAFGIIIPIFLYNRLGKTNQFCG